MKAWPRLDSGQLDLRKDTFKLMSHVPGIAGVRALRESLRVITGAKLPIGRGRNRPSLFPFGTLTSRNAHARSLFNAHAGLRSFMVCPPGRILVYLDWRAQEPGLGAAFSGDQALMAAYASVLTRKIETVYGWPLRLSTSPNLRTLYNFPLQGNGAEMLRLAAVRLCEIGHVPSMLVHDGILVELECKAQIAEVADVMRWAGREVCNSFEIGVDIDQELTPGQRFQDKRPVAKAMWGTILDALESVGALPRRLRA